MKLHFCKPDKCEYLEEAHYTVEKSAQKCCREYEKAFSGLQKFHGLSEKIIEFSHVGEESDSFHFYCVSQKLELDESGHPFRIKSVTYYFTDLLKQQPLLDRMELNASFHYDDDSTKELKGERNDTAERKPVYGILKYVWINDFKGIITGQGQGSALMRAFLKEARRLKIPQIRGKLCPMSPEYREPLIRFYKRFGFSLDDQDHLQLDLNFQK